MKKLTKLDVEAVHVLDACIESIDNGCLRDRFIAARPAIIKEFVKYVGSAEKNTLYEMVASKWGHPNQIVCGDLCKAELMQLYSKYMVGATTLGRGYYEKIIMLAPLLKCPYCGFGQVTTLDHFLTKSRYPSVSVHFSNLVPSCFDCNRGRDNQEVTEQNQSVHPYFLDVKIEKTAWIFARVIEEVPLSVEYFIKPPREWSEELRGGVSNHFSGFALARRFGVEAASELSDLIDTLSDLDVEEDRRDHLTQVAKTERSRRPNGWQAALYEALSLNDWYISGGFRLCLDAKQLGF